MKHFKRNKKHIFESIKMIDYWFLIEIQAILGHFLIAASRSALGLRSVFNPAFPFTGPTTLVPSVQREDSQTEERIAQILNEAQQAMQIKKAMEQVQILSLKNRIQFFQNEVYLRIN